eukprot:3824607-Amphidinium_carterae.3
MLLLDVKDAFFKLRLARAERKYAVARIIAGRGRLCQGLFDSSRARLELYVDDPVLACSGSELEARLFHRHLNGHDRQRDGHQHYCQLDEKRDLAAEAVQHLPGHVDSRMLGLNAWRL